MSEDNTRPEPTLPSQPVGGQTAPPAPLQEDHTPVVGEAAPAEPEDDAYVWTASEYVAHHKDMKWYGTVVGITIVVSAVAYLLTRDLITGITLFVLGVLFCLAGGRKPRTLTYALDDHGIIIGPRFFPYSSFKSFSVVREGAFANIELIPFKRFMPVTSIFCPPENEEEVTAILSEFVPYEERPRSFIESFGHRIRF